MKKLVCAAALLSSVLATGVAMADEPDFLVKLGARLNLGPKVSFSGAYNQGPAILNTGAWGATGDIADSSSNKDCEYKMKFPGVFLDFTAKMSPFFGVDLGVGYNGRRHTDLTVKGGYGSATTGDMAHYNAKTPQDTITMRNEGFNGRVGASLMWSNSSLITPFIGGFVGLEYNKYKLLKDTMKTYNALETTLDLGSKTSFIFGGKVGVNLLFSESGFGVSANYVIQNAPEEQVTSDFTFSDNALNNATPPVADANTFIPKLKVRNSTQIKHGVELAVMQSF